MLIKQDYEKIYSLAERGFIETPMANEERDNMLGKLDEFRDTILRLDELEKLRHIVDSEYMSYNSLIESIPKEGYVNIDHPGIMGRAPWELEIIYKLQILRKILLELKK